MSFAKGDPVKWKWGENYAHGTVSERRPETIERTIKGSTITRHGEKDNAALIIHQDDGQEVLKLESEVSRDAAES